MRGHLIWLICVRMDVGTRREVCEPKGSPSRSRTVQSKQRRRVWSGRLRAYALLCIPAKHTRARGGPATGAAAPPFAPSAPSL